MLPPDKIPTPEDPKQEQVINEPGPNREEVPKEKIDPKTGKNIDPHDDGDGEGG